MTVFKEKFVVDNVKMPLNVDIYCVHCHTFNSVVVHLTLNVRQSIHFGLTIRHIQYMYTRNEIILRKEELCNRVFRSLRTSSSIILALLRLFAPRCLIFYRQCRWGSAMVQYMYMEEFECCVHSAVICIYCHILH